MIKNLGILIAFYILSISANAAEWSNIPFHENAQNKNEYVFSNSAAKQISYEIKAKYPSLEILSFYKKSIGNKWSICKGKEQWDSFGDLAGESPLFIHQLIQYWVNYSENKFIMLAIKYESQGSEYLEYPDTNIQKVFLVEYKENDLSQVLKMLKLEC